MNLRERLGVRLLGAMTRRGTLAITLPGGETAEVGSGDPRADLTITDHRAVSQILRRGLLGFAEAYMDEDITTTDLPELLRWATANREAWFDHPIARLSAPLRRWWQRIRPERRHPRVTSMADHYDLGNEFYEAWLDSSMTYSSARFASPTDTLEAAQHTKYRAMADHAGLRPGMRVLEIGCGWGGFAEYAATERGCEVVGITLSTEQAAYARARMKSKGIDHRVDIRIADFREDLGRFDAVVSIEMIESVDETHWAPLFEAIARALRPGSVAAMQIITIEDRAWETYRRRPDFIQHYIFPGGQIPAPKVVRSLSGDAGLRIEAVETFGLDYARTLAEWRRRFEAAWDRLAKEHGLDERFRRMWDLYLSLCEAGFRMGRIDVQQWVFSAP
ncbi:MAG TPA: cyclopropane-fatty-acyl-phospholipid synthase family protein [Acidimicrobiia bacterium]|nr:cyclopropane-fatty-acyl-phospholipid synthase family protein [Acidimicrobiia bacterium]